MKPSLALVCALTLVLPAAALADTVASSNPLVTGTGSQMDTGGYGTYNSASSQYVLSTTNDLLYDKTAIANTYGTYADNTYNTGWTAQEASNDPSMGGVANNAAYLANLTDGNFGGELQSNGRFGAASGGDSNSGAGYTATYNLGSNPNGYNLTDIEVYSGWGDSGRYQQAYTIKYSLDTAPTTFLTLTTVGDYPTDLTERGAETALTPTSGPYLASNVEDVEIVFDTVANGWSGYREVVVNGVAAPEPSTYGLVALGGAGLALLLRRRAQASV